MIEILGGLNFTAIIITVAICLTVPKCLTLILRISRALRDISDTHVQIEEMRRIEKTEVMHQ